MASGAAEFRVPERVRFDNAVTVRQAGERFLDEAATGPVRISLGQLAERNSVVVALLLAWVRHARERGRTVQFVDVPDDLRNIIELYGVAGILPLEGGGAGTAWTVADDERADADTGAAAGQGEQA
jgi:phospholipid transport system transporter-binding protein